MQSSRTFSVTLKNSNIKTDNSADKITEFLGFRCHDPIKGDLVYVGTIHKMVKKIKLFSLSTSIFAIALQPMILQKVLGTLSITTVLTLMMNIFLFSTPIFLHLITKRYVVNIYHEEKSNTFTATTYSLFLQQKLLKFKPKYVQQPLKPMLFSNLLVNNTTPLFIDPSLFLSKKAYITLMKYDEPLDWQFEEKIKDKINE